MYTFIYFPLCSSIKDVPELALVSKNTENYSKFLFAIILLGRGSRLPTHLDYVQKFCGIA